MENLTTQEKQVLLQVVSNVAKDNPLGFLMQTIAAKLQKEIQNDNKKENE